jgi:hypothetical protein
MTLTWTDQGDGQTTAQASDSVSYAIYGSSVSGNYAAVAYWSESSGVRCSLGLGEFDTIEQAQAAAQGDCDNRLES